MRVALIALTKKGTKLGEELAGKLLAQVNREDQVVHLYAPKKFSWGKEFSLPEKLVFPFTCPLRELVAYLFPRYTGFVFIMAAGIVVRLVAPLFKDKRQDPAVVVIDEQGRFAVSLLSGHLGGANELAERVASAAGAQAVITTATDSSNILALDVLAKKMQMVYEPPENLKKINAALVNGEKVSIFTEAKLPEVRFEEKSPDPIARSSGDDNSFLAAGHRWPAANIEVVPLKAFPENASNFIPPHQADLLKLGAFIFVTNKVVDVTPLEDVPYVFLRPKNLAAGIGCRRGTKPEEIIAALQFALARAKLALASIRVLASISLKQKEQGLREAARLLDREIKFFSPEEIASCSYKFSDSNYVKKIAGVGGVCEPAACLAAGKAARLLLPKTVYHGVTIAIAQED